MVHYKETKVAVKQHEGELAGAVVVNDADDFVGKSPKAEDVGNRMVVDVIDEIEAGVDIREVIVLDEFDKAGHGGVSNKDRGTDAGSFRGGASNAFPGVFNPAF
jgi:hypothetical protein